MREDATLKVGRYTVVVDYYDNSNSIHVEATVNGEPFSSDICLLTAQCNDDGGKWLENDNEECGAPMSAAQWKKIDGWLTSEDHY
mgnify:FL=1